MRLYAFRMTSYAPVGLVAAPKMFDDITDGGGQWTPEAALGIVYPEPLTYIVRAGGITKIACRTATITGRLKFPRF